MEGLTLLRGALPEWATRSGSGSSYGDGYGDGEDFVKDTP